MVAASPFPPGPGWLELAPGEPIPAGCLPFTEGRTGKRYVLEAQIQGGVRAKPLLANASEIAQFVDLLFLHADSETFVALRAFDQFETGTTAKLRQPIRINGSLEPVARAAALAATASADGVTWVFAPPVATFANAQRARTQDLANGLTLTVELDEGNTIDAQRRLEAILGPVTCAVASGSECADNAGEVFPKLHLHWRLSEPTREADEHEMLRQARDMATRLVGGDPTGKPIVHPFRWPGSWNLKAKPRLARLRSVTPTAEIHLVEAFDQLTDAIEAAGATAFGASPSATPEDPTGHYALAMATIPNPDLHYNDWVRWGYACWRASGGSGDGFDAWDAWSRKSTKYHAGDQDAAWSRIGHAINGSSAPRTIGAGTIFWSAAQAGWVRPLNGASEPPATPDDPGYQASLDEQARGADSKPPPRPNDAPQQNAAPRVGRILTGADFMARHVPPVWLIDGIVQRGRLYSCTSLTGHGKTAVWLHNACMIQSGRPIGNRDTFRGNVLYLAGENPADLEARMIGTARTHNLAAGQLPYVLPGGFPLTDVEIDALKREIAALRVPLAMIVGDTASSFFPGDDENSNVQSGQYARTLRGLADCEGNPAVMMLTHPIKNASRSNLLPRGGGAFLNEVDGNLTTWSEVTGELTELHWQGKIRGPDFSPFGYRLRSVPTGLNDEKGRPEITIVAEPMSEEAVADHTKQVLANEDVVLRAVRDHPEWSWAQTAREAGWVDDSQQPEKWKVQRALRALHEDKLIDRPRKGARWRVTDKGRKILSGED